MWKDPEGWRVSVCRVEFVVKIWLVLQVRNGFMVTKYPDEDKVPLSPQHNSSGKKTTTLS